jgi:hypothetical protein
LPRIHPVAGLAGLIVAGALVFGTAVAGTSGGGPGRPQAGEPQLTGRVVPATATAGHASVYRALFGAASLVSRPMDRPLLTIAGPDVPAINIVRTGKTLWVDGPLRSGGVEVTAALTGQLMLIRFDQNANTGRLRAALAQAAVNPNALGGVATIVLDAAARAGHVAVQTTLQPGSYEALNVTNGNRSRWPVSYFHVAKSGQPVGLAKPGASIEAIDFGFRGTWLLHDGELVRFGNGGYLVHMIAFYRAATRADASRIAADLRHRRDAQASKLAVLTGLFTGPLSHNQWQQQVIANHPGYYVLACALRTQSGRYQTRLGMVQVIRIVR